MQPTPESSHPPEMTPPTNLASAARQVTQLLREKWAEYVVEMLVIVFSITASFAVDEWKDARSKRELEQTCFKDCKTTSKPTACTWARSSPKQTSW